MAGLIENVRDILETIYNSFEDAFDASEDITKARKITAHMQYYENLKIVTYKNAT